MRGRTGEGMPWTRHLLWFVLAASTACGSGELSAPPPPVGPTTGSLTVTITGLPTGSSAAVTVSGPGGFSRVLAATETIAGLTPGAYQVTTAPVTTPTGRYMSAVGSVAATVVASNTPATAQVQYDLVTGTLMVTIAGLPSGSAAAVTVTGPGGFSRTLAASQSFSSLEPGTYMVAAAPLTIADDRYAVAPETQSVTVTAAATPAPVAVTYAITSGRLAIAVAGLPAQVDGRVTVTGPTGVTNQVTTSATLPMLPLGTYTLSAASTTVGSTTFTPTPPSQTVTVSAGATATATVTYAAVFGLRLAQVVTGLTSPVHLTSPIGDARLFVVEQIGRVRIVRNGQLVAQPFLDIRTRVHPQTFGNEERGLLGLAFHPNYASNGFLFVYYTNVVGDIVVERYQVTANPDVASATGTVVLTIPHASDPYHNGGGIAFGPDGFLYLGIGDGACCRDPLGSGQNRNTLLGKLLRLDVATLPYTIPATNPFVGQANRRGEIWAYGLRNPWRFDFDAIANALYIADVGEDLAEEVNASVATQGGLNYGWSLMEGQACFVPGCSMLGLTLPVVSYGRSVGCSVIGGSVYRGSALPEVAGHYFYSDFCQGFLRSFQLMNGAATQARDWGIAPVSQVTSMGRDSQGELYVLTLGGALLKLVRR